MNTLLPWLFWSYIVAIGEQFLFCSPTASELSGIYKDPRRTLIRFNGTSWLRSSPLVAAPAALVLQRTSCKFRCSLSGLQPHVFRSD